MSAFLFLRPANVLVDAPEPPRHTSRDPRGAPTLSGQERAAIVLQRGSLLLRVGLLCSGVAVDLERLENPLERDARLLADGSDIRLASV